MRLASYMVHKRRSYGVVLETGIVDLGARIGTRYPDLRALLEAGAVPEALKTAEQNSPDVGLDDVEWMPTIPNPDKVICAGVNYKSHLDESGLEAKGYPVLFPRFAATQVGHLQPMVCPRESEQLDYEGELVVVIGRAGRRIPEDRALSHIAGYSIYNEGSVRDWQLHTSQWTPGKNFAGTGAFGPWLVTSDEISDPYALEITTRLNGQVMQQASVGRMLFPIELLVAYISTFVPLVPGDVIATGTPGGVGHARKPPVYLKASDCIEVEISGIGTLRNPIVKEAEA